MSNKKFPLWTWTGDPNLLMKCKWECEPGWMFCHSGLCPGRIKLKNYTDSGFCIFDVYTGNMNLSKLQNNKVLQSEYELFKLYKSDQPNKNRIRIIRIKGKEDQ